MKNMINDEVSRVKEKMSNVEMDVEELVAELEEEENERLQMMKNSYNEERNNLINQIK